MLGSNPSRFLDLTPFPFQGALQDLGLRPSLNSNRVFEIVSDYVPVLHLELCSRLCLLFNTSPNDREQHDGNDSNSSQVRFVEIKLM